jgi:hypothetical protein
MGRVGLERLFWWDADEAERSPQRIAAQVMALGTLEDICEVRKRFGPEIFEEVLSAPPRGLFDAKSWSFWHKKLGHREIPALPGQPAAWPLR